MNLGQTAARALRRRGPALLLTACALGTATAVATPASAYNIHPYSPTPSNVHVNATGRVTWTPMSGAADYVIFRDGTSWVGNVSGGSSWQWQDTINDGVAHTYTVAAWFPGESIGQLAFSAPVTEPPLNVRQTNGQICWDAVADHASVPYDAYALFFNGSVNPAAYVTGATCYTNTWGLAAGTAYTVQVASASESNTIESDLGQGLTFTYETAPTGLNAEMGFQQVGLTWNPVTGADLYIIYRDGQKLATSTTASYVDKTAVSNVQYHYTVQAVHSAFPGGESAQSTSVPGQAF